jgi:hypothetical protein
VVVVVPVTVVVVAVTDVLVVVLDVAVTVVAVTLVEDVVEVHTPHINGHFVPTNSARSTSVHIAVTNDSPHSGLSRSP